MRIISGELGGRALRSLPDGRTRPAMGRTREALFSMLEARGVDWRTCGVLDLFAGTGSLAFEAVSRGAPQAVLVDSSKEQCACIAMNIAELGLENRCRLIMRDVSRFLRSTPGKPFELVFIDPPYRRNYVPACLNALTQKGWLARNAFVVAEIEKDASLAPPESLEPVAQRLFGQTLLQLWTYNENSALPRDI